MVRNALEIRSGQGGASNPLIAALARSDARYSTSVPRTYFRVIRPLFSAR